jgi:glycosyltransferase involved in cell wall biosynthesis
VNLAILNWRDLAHPDSGGAEVFVHEVGRRWVAEGHSVTVYSSRSAGLPHRSMDEGMVIERVGALKTGAHHVAAPRRLAGRHHDAVLESINTVPYMLPVRRRHLPPFLPIVHQLAVDVWSFHLPRPAAAVARTLEPILFRPYRKTVCAAVSESTRLDLSEAGVSDVRVIPQGGIGPQQARPKVGDPTLLFVGRLSANKRPDHAIAIFREVKMSLPLARLWIVGEGSLRNRLEHHLPSDTEFLGRLPRTELMDRMARAHLLIVTSVREGWGLVVTEANSLGTPAVAYDVPGLRDSIQQDVTGVLTQPSPRHAAASILKLLRDRDRYDRLCRNARGWGARCSWDKTASSLLSLVMECTEDRHSPAA